MLEIDGISHQQITACFQDRRFKPLSQFSTFVFASVRKPLQRFAKTRRMVWY